MARPYGVSSLAVSTISERPHPPTLSTRGLPDRTRLNITRFLLLGWSTQDIADREHCSKNAVYNVANNLKNYGSIRAPIRGRLGHPPHISEADAEALFRHLICSGWMYQDEIVYWLWVERGVRITQSNVSRFLARRGWSRRTLRPFSINRNEELRAYYRNTMRRYAAEDIVFLDESIFNEKTGWRHSAYGPVGTTTRYTQDITRGRTWAILPAYTVNGYLSGCTAIKEGYFNHEDFLAYLEDQLLPTLRTIYGPKALVIVLDNVSIHTNDDVRELIESAGYSVQYLPPYSPDYNPIELTFGVLKAWIKRNYLYIRQRFGNDFGAFLAAAVRESKCDRFARKHFWHAAGGLYIEQEVLDRARREIRELGRMGEFNFEDEEEEQEE